MSNKGRVVLLVGLAVVLVAGGIVWSIQQDRAAEAERIQAIVNDAGIALQRVPVDMDELSSVMARIEKDPAGEQIPAFRRVRAQVWEQRGNPGRAWDAIGPLAMGVDATLADTALGARICLKLSGRRSGGDGETMARNAMGLATRWADADGGAEALFLAIQGALRSREIDEARSLGERLLAEAPRSDVGRLWAAAAPILLDREKGVPAAPIDQVLGAYGEAPVEGLVALVWALVDASDAVADGAETRRLVDKAAEVAAFALERGPAVLEARAAAWAAQAGSAILAQQAGDMEGFDRHLRQAAVHARFLLENAPGDDPRRSGWQQLSEAAAQRGN